MGYRIAKDLHVEKTPRTAQYWSKGKQSGCRTTEIITIAHTLGTSKVAQRLPANDPTYRA
jgi:hypothetical protein